MSHHFPKRGGRVRDSTPGSLPPYEAESEGSSISDSAPPSGDLSVDFHRMTVHSPPPQYITQQQTMAVKQDTQISQSDAMISLLRDISISLQQLNARTSGPRGDDEK